MNCHQNIAEYNGEEDLENGYTKDFYTKEIKKLYAAVGWDGQSKIYSESQPVKWVRIHNLPDFVYFNHVCSGWGDRMSEMSRASRRNGNHVSTFVTNHGLVYKLS